MHDVNWWLMAIAFILGLLLTLAFMIRRVKREVPVYAGRASGRAAGLKGGDVDVEGRDADVKGRGVAAGAAVGATGAATATTAAKFTGGKTSDVEEPYGSGSIRIGKGASAPSGWTVKGNEDSMLYHTPDSPSYKQTIAEIWFRDEETAQKAGFGRWDRNNK